MKLFLTMFPTLLLCHIAFGQYDFDKWQEESKHNKALMPLYGHLQKTAEEISNDSDFVSKILAMPEFKTRRQASNHLIDLGFQYYYRPDLKTAMYRFNQAWLLDPTNTDIYWGYGAIYMAFGRYDLAKEQYDKGLSIDPNNTHLLTDLATYFMEEFELVTHMPKNNIVTNPKEIAKGYMDSAIQYLTRSYQFDPKDVNTVYKLSVCYWNSKSCDNAWKYYDEAVALGSRPITEDYTKDLKKLCKRK